MRLLKTKIYKKGIFCNYKLVSFKYYLKLEIDPTLYYQLGLGNDTSRIIPVNEIRGGDFPVFLNIYKVKNKKIFEATLIKDNFGISWLTLTSNTYIKDLGKECLGYGFIFVEDDNVFNIIKKFSPNTNIINFYDFIV